MSNVKSYDQWVRDPGIYAGYEDYVKGVKAVREYQDREREKAKEKPKKRD